MTLRHGNDDWVWGIERRDDGKGHGQENDNPSSDQSSPNQSLFYTSQSSTHTTSIYTRSISAETSASSATTTQIMSPSISTRTSSNPQLPGPPSIPGPAPPQPNTSQSNLLLPTSTPISTSISISTTTISQPLAAVSSPSEISETETTYSKSSSIVIGLGIALIVIESIIIIGTLIFFIRRNFARSSEGKRGKVAHWMREGGGSFGNTTIVGGGERNGGAGFVSGVMVQTEQGQDLLANENQNTGRAITIDISMETETVAANGIDGGNGRQREAERHVEHASRWQNMFGSPKREPDVSDGSEKGMVGWRTPVNWVLDQRRRMGNWGKLSG